MDKTVLVDLDNEVDVVGNYFADSCFVGNGFVDNSVDLMDSYFVGNSVDVDACLYLHLDNLTNGFPLESLLKPQEAPCHPEHKELLLSSETPNIVDTTHSNL